MLFQIIKIIISAILIWAISEISKKFSFWGAVLASVPLISVLSFIWMYDENKDIAKISRLSYSIFWLVIPSLVLFVVFPVLLKLRINFFLALILSIGATSLSYWLTVCILGWCDIKL